MIFCLTSPGFTSLANTPKFISYFIENMRTNYGMGDYVWVREHTKRGFPHFHFIAHWNNPQWFFACSKCGGKMRGKECTECYNNMSRVNRISLYWSRLFDCDSLNSVRLGSYQNKKRTSFYVVSSRQCRYLTKYIGKNIGESFDYLGEAGFPSVKYRKCIQSFRMSERLAEYSQPMLWKSDYIPTGKRTIKVNRVDKANYRITEEFEEIPTGYTRVWRSLNSDEILTDTDLGKYDWQWTGHGQCYWGLTSDRGQ